MGSSPLEVGLPWEVGPIWPLRNPAFLIVPAELAQSIMHFDGHSGGVMPLRRSPTTWVKIGELSQPKGFGPPIRNPITYTSVGGGSGIQGHSPFFIRQRIPPPLAWVKTGPTAGPRSFPRGSRATGPGPAGHPGPLLQPRIRDAPPPPAPRSQGLTSPSCNVPPFVDPNIVPLCSIRKDKTRESKITSLVHPFCGTHYENIDYLASPEGHDFGGQINGPPSFQEKEHAA